jgi:hypothetical protein
VVQAGLLPRLRREPPAQGTWDAVVFHPGKYPFLSLAAALEAVRNPDGTDATREVDAAKLSGSWARGELPLDFTLDRACEALQVDRMLLIVDQFEELFTESSDADRREFVTKLLAADPARVRVLLTLRADFYGRALELSRDLSDLMQRGIINVGAMTREERREAIEQPARLVGMDFDKGLVERILDDVGDEPGELPLLEFALTELWERRDGRRLTHSAYEGLGRVTGAIGRRADSVFDTLTPDQQSAAPRLFVRLVRVSAADEQGADTRQRARLRDLDPAARSVAEPFIKGRLLVASRDEPLADQAPPKADPAPPPPGDLTTVEVAHEALIRTWDHLKTWIDDDREFLLWRRRLNFLITEWERSRRDPGALLRGASLMEALRFARDRRTDLNDREREFLAQSGRTRTARHHIDKVIEDALRILNLANSDTVVRWFATLAPSQYMMQTCKRVSVIKSQPIRFQVLQAISLSLAQAGLTDQARAAALEAKDAVLGFEVWYERSRAQASVVVALARAGLADQAKEVALGIELAYERSTALGSAVVALSQAGLLDEAREAALEAKESVRGMGGGAFDERKSIALNLARAGLAGDARQIASRFGSEVDSSKLLLSIATIFAHAGLPDEARAAAFQAKEAVLKITLESYRTEGLVSVVVALAQTGHLAEAKEAAVCIEGSNASAKALVSIALGRAGLLAEAREAALQAKQALLSMGQWSRDSEVMVSVAAALTQAGLLDEAKEFALGIESSATRFEALESVVVALARSGFLDEAKEVALKAQEVALGISYSNDISQGRTPGVQALVSVAAILAQAELLDQAQEVALKAQEVALGIKDPDDRSKALALVAETLARAGFAARAHDIATQIHAVEERSRALASVAKARARKLEFRQARRIAKSCDLPNDRLDAFTTILSEYTRRKKPELAKVLDELENPKTRPDD